MGHTHALTGAAVWLAAAPALAAVPYLAEPARVIEAGIMAQALAPPELLAGALVPAPSCAQRAKPATVHNHLKLMRAA